MAIDSSIPLQVRQQQAVNPAELYGNALALQGNVQRNALLGLQTQQAQHALDDERKVRNALLNVTDMNEAPRVLMQQGLYKPAMEIQGKVLQNRNTQSQIDERDAKILDHYYKAAGGVFGSIASNPQATREDVMAGLQTLKGLGLPDHFISALAQRIPANTMQIPAFARQVAVASENGRQALTALAPKVEFRGTGQQDIAYNTNPLAGPVAPMQSVAPIQKVATPEAVMTDDRTRSEGAANRGVTVRGQNMTDSRQREQIAQGRTAIVTDEAGNITVVNKDTRQALPALDAQGQPLKAKDKPLTGEERISAGYAERMERAGKILDGAFKDRPESKPGDFERTYGTPGLLESGLRKPVGGEVLANSLWRSPGRQQYLQAAEDWVRAKLRKESGAVIGEEEMAREIRTYFPQIGDKPEVIAQKAKARETAAQSMRYAAGKAKVPGASGGEWTIERVK